ncbi:Uncharacterised protein [Vibrio cholerae]|nr:Uncharacterised protein [Vibrio cholerae]
MSLRGRQFGIQNLPRCRKSACPYAYALRPNHPALAYQRRGSCLKIRPDPRALKCDRSALSGSYFAYR